MLKDNYSYRWNFFRCSDAERNQYKRRLTKQSFYAELFQLKMIGVRSGCVCLTIGIYLYEFFRRSSVNLLEWKSKVSEAYRHGVVLLSRLTKINCNAMPFRNRWVRSVKTKICFCVSCSWDLFSDLSEEQKTSLNAEMKKRKTEKRRKAIPIQSFWAHK